VNGSEEEGELNEDTKISHLLYLIFLQQPHHNPSRNEEEVEDEFQNQLSQLFHLTSLTVKFYHHFIFIISFDLIKNLGWWIAIG